MSDARVIRGPSRKDVLADLWISLFVRRRFYRFWSLVHELSLHGMGVQNHRPAGTGESAFLQWLGKIDTGRAAPAWVFDVGANVGDYTAAVRRGLPAARILCFEPHPRTVGKLRQRAVGLRADVEAAAVGRERGNVELYDYADMRYGADQGSEHATVYRDIITDLNKRTSTCFRVPVTTIDHEIEVRQLARVFLLKIDTEGHELAVLDGARQSLARGIIDAVQLEFNETNVYSRTFFRDLMGPLAGYRLFRMLPDGLVPLDYSPRKTEIFGFQNIVALNPELAGRALRSA